MKSKPKRNTNKWKEKEEEKEEENEELDTENELSLNGEDQLFGETQISLFFILKTIPFPPLRFVQKRSILS